VCATKFVNLACLPIHSRTYCRWISDDTCPRYRCMVELTPSEGGGTYTVLAEVYNLETKTATTDTLALVGGDIVLEPSDLAAATNALFERTLQRALEGDRVHTLRT